MTIHIGIPEAIYLLLLFAQLAAGWFDDFKLYNTTKDKPRFIQRIIVGCVVTVSYFGLLYWGGFFA